MKTTYELTDDYEAIPTIEDDKEALEHYYQKVGERIKKAREETAYTQAKLADFIGLTPSAIANYESGIRQIPIHILLDIASQLGKPLDFFLGPISDPQILIVKSLKSAVERLTEATYIEDIYELKDGQFYGIGKPSPLIPLPPEFTKDHNFALRCFNEKTETYSFYICKWYKPHLKRAGMLFFKKTISVDIEPDPNDWVIAEPGDSQKFELVQYKNVTPSAFSNWKKEGKEKIINVRAIVLARLERLVK